MAGFWGRRRREEQEAQDAADADLARRAGAALVSADERIRVTTDELEFARAELGEKAVGPLAEALTAVRTHLREAYQLNQLNHDEIPDTVEETRTRNARIIQLCEWAESVLDERTAALQDRIELVRRAPQILEGVRRDTAALSERVPGAKEVIARLELRYNDDAMRQIRNGADEIENLLAFASHSANVSARRREAGRNEEANLALETATEAVRRATTILDGIDDFELEAMRAESTLADVIADSRGDLIRARTAPRSPAVTAAATQLDAALRALPAPGTRTDPFTELSVLREANSALDDAIAKAVERAARPLPPIATVRHAVDDADRQLAVAQNVISGHRGWIGADARTRLAEAERLRQDIDQLIEPEDTREQALMLARRTGSLAAQALQLAQRDIDSSRPDDRWDGPRGGGRGMSGGDMLGGLIGGAILGGIIGDIFD
ncbi:hypothetical protein [Microbacterium nymphoidis]|jgi:hypothetical protein|uniref:hypothetical protein n=2 Tax=Microbacterium TaxID=33882 RepID=UPI001E50970B|nr:hypothetical protein [Microbacterium nymphoidis]MCD2499773.1 hypothetical protein [Microbacterium nymphoidis]